MRFKSKNSLALIIKNILVMYYTSSYKVVIFENKMSQALADTWLPLHIDWPVRGCHICILRFLLEYKPLSKTPLTVTFVIYNLILKKHLYFRKGEVGGKHLIIKTLASRAKNCTQMVKGIKWSFFMITVSFKMDTSIQCTTYCCRFPKINTYNGNFLPEYLNWPKMIYAHYLASSFNLSKLNK